MPKSLPKLEIPKPAVRHDRNSKNEYVTSVVTSTPQPSPVLANTIQTADVKTSPIENTPTGNHVNGEQMNSGYNRNMYRASKNEYDLNKCHPSPLQINTITIVDIKASPVENIGNKSTSNGFDKNMYSSPKNEYNINKCSDVLTDCSTEDNISPDISDSEHKVKNRMLDPDAMIESLDRFTAELVSHSAHLNSHECKPMNQSGGDTWNEDTSPNDISFPSISISAPLVASFKSETDSKISVKSDEENRNSDNQYSSINTMTDSTIIQLEAIKLYNVHNELDMQQSITDLENVNPPSMLESIVSLTSSIAEVKNTPKNSPLSTRKKCLGGLMVRRALGNCNQKSLENESVSSSCNLEQIKPPSVMGDYLDMVDMESSMVSVASITSEVAEETKTNFQMNGPVSKMENVKTWTFDIKSLDSSEIENSVSLTQIENINPPSLLNEVTDLCNSTADVITENVYNSSTDVFEDCFTHTVDQTLLAGDTFTADEVTEYSDACSITPVQSDFATSSAESTPKKIKNVNKRLTPKQKRQLAKERYKTYTVAAELVMREASKSETISESPDILEGSDGSENSLSSPKLTPKERRLMNRERFQTRVLEKSPEITTENKFATFDKKTKNENLQSEASDKIIIRRPIESLQMNLTKLDIQTASNIEDSPKNSTVSRGIPLRTESSGSPTHNPRTKTDIRKAMQQKRLENKERFRTRTLSSDTSSPEVSPAPDRRTLTSEELHTMLERETNIILNTLEQTTSNVDDYLEYETLSLVSNDEDSEHNSVTSVNYRTYHKSWGFSKNLPVVKNTETLNSPVAEDESKILKPKIVKPGFETTPPVQESSEEQVKAIRGKKKAYISPYRSPVARTKPKNVTSNLVKNVTSSLTKTIPKSTPVSPQKSLKPPSGYTKTNRTSLPKMSPQKGVKRQSLPVKIERQGTFVKEEPDIKPTTSTKISEKTSKIARAIVGCKSKTAPNLKPPQKIQSKTISSTSKPESRSIFYSRSPSADRDKIKSSSSSQSLQNQEIRKRSSIPSLTQRSNSNVSIGSTESTGKKKQVTSKIASLWKKVEESKKKQPEKDNKKWITSTVNQTAEVTCDSTIVSF